MLAHFKKYEMKNYKAYQNFKAALQKPKFSKHRNHFHSRNIADSPATTIQKFFMFIDNLKK